MNENIQDFLRLMFDKRYNGTFSLFRDRHIALVLNSSLKKCLELLYSNESADDLKNGQYHLETSVLSKMDGRPIKCKFILKPELGDGIHIQQLIAIPPGNLPSQVRRIYHNRDLLGEALIPGLFSKPKPNYFDLMNPDKGYRRR